MLATAGEGTAFSVLMFLGIIFAYAFTSARTRAARERDAAARRDLVQKTARVYVRHYGDGASSAVARNIQDFKFAIEVADALPVARLEVAAEKEMAP